MNRSARARWVARGTARGAAVGGGGGALLGIFGFGVLYTEARWARRTVKPPSDGPPVVTGQYGAAQDPPLRLAVLGDSSAAGIGSTSPEQTPGARLAAMLAGTGRCVQLEVHAVSGARSADLEPQVDRALLTPPHLVVISVGANDVTHLVRATEAGAHLGTAVRRLVQAGVAVVVATCPDLGAVRPIAQPLRLVARLRSAEMAAQQRRDVADAGGVPVPLGALLSTAFRQDPDRYFSADRFHPSGEGYGLFAEALGPAVLDAAAAAVGTPGRRRRVSRSAGV